MENRRTSRRTFLGLSAAVPAVSLILGDLAAAAAQPRPLAPTPSCPDDATPTPRQTEGPFYRPESPRRASLLEPGMTGTRIVLTGRVLSTTCAPVAGALVDFWQADDHGAYDNRGYRLRGHQLTDDAGRYRLETIVPGAYPGRTPHFHVKVAAPGRPPLTTQLYLPDEPANRRDPIFRPELVVRMAGTAGEKLATFDFVLDLGDRPRRG